MAENSVQYQIRLKTPNPLFEQWLNEWRLDAESKGLDKHRLVFENALSSLRKFPLVLKKGRHCYLLEHFNKGLCEMLDLKLAQYKSKFPIGRPKKFKFVYVNEEPNEDEDIDVVGLGLPNEGQDTSNKIMVPNPGNIDIYEKLDKDLKIAANNLLSILYKETILDKKDKFVDEIELWFMIQEKMSAVGISLFKNIVKYICDAGLVGRVESPNRFFLTENGQKIANQLMIDETKVNSNVNSNNILNDMKNDADENFVEVSIKSKKGKYLKKRVMKSPKKITNTVSHTFSSSSDEDVNISYSTRKKLSPSVKPEPTPQENVIDFNDMKTLSENLYLSNRMYESNIFDYTDILRHSSKVGDLSFLTDIQRTSPQTRVDLAEFDTFNTPRSKDLNTNNVSEYSSRKKVKNTLLNPEPSKQNNITEVMDAPGPSSQTNAVSVTDIHSRLSQKNVINMVDVPESSSPGRVNELQDYLTQTAAPASANAIAVKDIVMRPGNYNCYLVIDKAETLWSKNENANESILKKAGIRFVLRHLTVGDYTWICLDPDGNELILPYIAERKQLDDFGKSIRDKRFHEQKVRLKAAPVKQRIYIVEGNEKAVQSPGGIPIESIKQAALNTLIIDGFNVKFTNDYKQTLFYLSTLTKKFENLLQGKTVKSGVPNDVNLFNWSDDILTMVIFESFNKNAQKKKVFTVREMFLRHLLQMHGVSVEKAKEIVNKYPCPSTLINLYRNGENENLLAKMKIGKSGRSLGVVLSKSIYSLYSKEQFL